MPGTTGGAIAERLARIETKLDSLLDIGLDHEARIRHLESLDLGTLKDNETKRADHADNTRRLVYIAILTAFILPLTAALILHALQAR